MAVTIKGKTYKGKYKGPDKFKGDEKKIAAWKASKRKAATAPAPAPTSSPAAPVVPDPTNQSVYNPPDPNATASNASGTIQLQSNYEIDMAEADAHEAIDKELAAARQSKEQALLTNKLQTEALDKQTTADRKGLTTGLAYRGLTRGTTATDKSAKLASEHQSKRTEIASELSNTNAAADAVLTGEAARRAALDKRFAAARQSYTNAQSKNSPTEGSKAEDSGVQGTVIAPPAPEPAAVEEPQEEAVIGNAVETVATKKYKGKYKGPDKFKGDEKKIAAWKAAKRKAGK